MAKTQLACVALDSTTGIPSCPVVSAPVHRSVQWRVKGLLQIAPETLQNISLTGDFYSRVFVLFTDMCKPALLCICFDSEAGLNTCYL